MKYLRASGAGCALGGLFNLYRFTLAWDRNYLLGGLLGLSMGAAFFLLAELHRERNPG